MPSLSDLAICDRSTSEATLAVSAKQRALPWVELVLGGSGDPCGICKAARVVAQRMSQGNIVETAASPQNNSYGNPQS